MEDGSVSGGVRCLLRAEGLAVFLLSLFAYAKLGSGWGLFALLFFIPDLFLLGYALGGRAGAILYNAAHSYIGALLCLASGVYFSLPTAVSAGIIWVAHIAFDRMLGYGLKYEKGFRFTHLGKIGRRDN